MARLALYGNVGLLRTFCDECQQTCLVVRGLKQCCNRPEGDPDAVVGAERISEPDSRKKQPTKAEKIRILRRQDYRCLYCERRLESSAWYKGKYILLRINWDHVLPFEYSRSNEPENFVACCHVCNHWKSSRIFTYLEEIQVYVAEKWQRVETDVGKNLPGMRSHIPQ